MIISIQSKDVSPLTSSDLARLQGRCDVEGFVRMLLAASKTEGETAAVIRSSIMKLIPMLHHVALAQLEDLLPVQITGLLRRQDFEDCSLWLISDDAGTFAAIMEGQHAIIGTREEIARILSFDFMPGAPPKGRRWRPDLRIVK